MLHLYNWNNYLAEETLRRFEQRCQCRVKQDYYSDNEEMLAKLEAGAVGYDLLVPTGNAVESLIRRDALRPLDKTKLPHLANVKPEFRNPWFDPDNRYSVPYASTVTLIGYNVEKLRALGLPTDTWALIFEPRHLEKIRGKVTVLNSQRELMAAAMKYLGYSVQEADLARWDEAKRLILRAKPYWATFSNSTYIKDLAMGNIWVAHGYSNDMFRAREDAKAAGRALHHRLHDPEGRRRARRGQLRAAQVGPAARPGAPVHRLHARGRECRRRVERHRRRQYQCRRHAAYPAGNCPGTRHFSAARDHGQARNAARLRPEDAPDAVPTVDGNQSTLKRTGISAGLT